MSAQPWVMTRDEALWAQVERAAAAADTAVRRCAAFDGPGGWRSAPLVIVDAACVGELACDHPPDRDRIAVLAVQPMTAGQWEQCVRLGVRQVVGPDDVDADLVRLLRDADETATAGRTVGAAPGRGGRIVAVVGACGGAGATVMAIALALRARRSSRAGRSVLLCDLDECGAGVDTAVGLEGVAGARWGDIAVSEAISRGRLPLDALYRALPRIPGAGAAVLTHLRGDTQPIEVAAAAAVLDAVVRMGDLGVVDLPRGALPTADHVAGRADLTALVVPADVRSCYAAARAAHRLASLGARVGLVVRGPSPGGIGAGDIAAALHLPLLAAMRPQPGLDRALDAGRGAAACARGPLRAAADAVLGHLAAA